MNIGIYGGTFDPPHLGHLAAIRAAKRAMNIDRLFLIPAGIPPHKLLKSSSARAEDRINMTKLAAKYVEDATVTDMETKREGKSYSVDTLAEFKNSNPYDKIFLFIGSDMLMMFEKWFHFEDIFKMCTVVVFGRNEGDTAMLQEEAERLMEKYEADIRVINNPAVEISSTELREKLQNREGCEYLTDEVYSYILENKLYGAKANFDWLRKKAYDMLAQKRIPHVAGCEFEAVKLAKRWGADEVLAREAAILHDITKKLDLDAQLQLCHRYGIMTDDMEKNNAKLLHSKTGAALAKDMFNVDDAVYDAIFWHTTGKGNMTQLEKIIYLADYIEPTRDFPGLDELRIRAYADLDSAMLLGLEMSLDDLREQNIPPHVKTQEAISFLKA